MKRRLVGTVCAALAALAACAVAQDRVVVIGVDGMDHALTRRLMDEGALPELKKLADEGGFSALKTTNPAQSPVAWATLTTGRDPGATGVFDFLKRTLINGEVGAELALVEKDPRRVRAPAVAAAAVLALALFGASRAARRRNRGVLARGLVLGAALFCIACGAAWALLPAEVVLPRNPRGGTALWERVDAAGVRGTSLLAPLAFPAPELQDGCLLCGLGTPDVAGTPGLAIQYREEPVPGGGRITPTGCRVSPVRATDDRLHGVFAEGPKDSAGRRVRAPISPLVLRAKRLAVISVGRGEATVGERQWTPWMPVSFRVAPFLDLAGLTRFRLLEGGARTVLYQEPTCFDPLRPSAAAPIATPRSFGAEIGGGKPFDTLGWACATNPLQDGLIDEETFLSDVEDLDRVREEMVMRGLEDASRRFFFCVLATPDRVQHLFWRDIDPEHPLHDAGAIARRGDPIRDSYRRLDALVGRVRRERLKPGDLLLVVSDHGFASFRVSVNLNRWLAEEGFLVGSGATAERTIETSLGGTSLFPGVDWAKTKAYSLGLGKIWINLAGREPHGCVPAAERRAAMETLRERLLALRHEGQPVVRSVKFREDLYRGDRVGGSADLILGFEAGYRISWQATLGSLDEPVFAPNRALWSGDHCSVDPDLVPGVLFASRPFEAGAPSIADIFPTVEAALGLSPTPGLDGTALKWKAP
jgi:predicted AlkP superfamily phosphohydrolase/phosphomutase